MLPARARLRRADEFAAAVRRGRRAGRSTLAAHLLITDEPAPPRAGFVVGRTVGPAVVRNRVRRRLRHLVLAHLADLAPGSVLVVRATPAAARASYEALAADLQSALRRVCERQDPPPASRDLPPVMSR